MARPLYTSLLVYCLASAERLATKECSDRQFSVKPASYHLQQNEYWAEETEVRDCLDSVTPLLGKWGLVWFSVDGGSWTDSSMTPRNLGGVHYGWRINEDNSPSAFSGNRLVAKSLKSKSVLEKLKNGMFNQTTVKLSNHTLSALKIHGNFAYTTGGIGGRPLTLHNPNMYTVDLFSMQVKAHPSGHGEYVNCIDVTDRLIVTGSSDRSTRILNRQNMTLITTLRDHNHLVMGCRVDGISLFTTSEDHTTIVHDIRAPITLARKLTLTGHTSKVWAVDMTDEYLATTSHDGSIRVWNRQNGMLLHTLTGGSWDMWHVKFLDNENIVSATNQQLLIWNFRRGQTIRRYGYQGPFHVSNGIFFCNTADHASKRIAVWDITAGVDKIPENPTTVIRTGYTTCGIDTTDNKIVTVGFEGHINVITIDP